MTALPKEGPRDSGDFFLGFRPFGVSGDRNFESWGLGFRVYRVLGGALGFKEVLASLGCFVLVLSAVWAFNVVEALRCRRARVIVLN